MRIINPQTDTTQSFPHEYMSAAKYMKKQASQNMLFPIEADLFDRLLHWEYTPCHFHSA